MKAALFYGTTTGNTGDIADKIKDEWDVSELELFDVADSSLNAATNYELLIFAIPTWDYGEVQEDWQEVWDEVDQLDFTGKQAAFIGLGDQFGYPEWFVDAMGMLHDKIAARGAEVVGHWSVDGYEFEGSKALTKDKKHFIGLALDEDWQREETANRITNWLDQVKLEVGAF